VIQTYEIQTYRGGVWQVDSVFDDEELAVFEAQLLHDRGRYVGVRVVLEIYNEETDQVSVRTILKFSKSDEENAAARLRKAKADKEIQKNKKRVGERKDGRRKAFASKKAKKRVRKAELALAAKLIVVVVLGFGLLIGMRIFFQYM
jgi:hypothetical protein